MKARRGILGVVVAVICAAGLFAVPEVSGDARQQSPNAVELPGICMLDQAWQNQNRAVTGAVYAECPPSIHSSPYGNWGVNSNAGSRYDGDQFMGWYYENGQHQWDSCTGGYRQESTEGAATYAWYRVTLDGEHSCSQAGVDGIVFTYQGNYMDMYELDPWWPDQFVSHAAYPDLSIVLNCNGGDSCYGESEWVNPVQVNGTELEAQVRVALWAFTN